MFKQEKTSKKRQIYTLISIFVSAMLIACVLSVVMLRYYNPSGIYLGKNVLLSPDHFSPKLKSKYVVDRVEFEGMPINAAQYAQIYALISNDESLKTVPENIERLFHQSIVPTLHLFLKDESKKNTTHFPFLSVEFIENGDYYRVNLRVESATPVWAYFYHPGIYQYMQTIISKQ